MTINLTEFSWDREAGKDQGNNCSLVPHAATGLCCLAVRTEHPWLEMRPVMGNKDNNMCNLCVVVRCFFNSAIYKCDIVLSFSCLFQHLSEECVKSSNFP